MQDYFKNTKTEPHYRDAATLNKFITSRKKIIGREKTGLSALNQRKLAKQIKYARYLGLLPYTSSQMEKSS